jgi:hypothetical protein
MLVAIHTVIAWYLAQPEKAMAIILGPSLIVPAVRRYLGIMMSIIYRFGLRPLGRLLAPLGLLLLELLLAVYERWDGHRAVH